MDSNHPTHSINYLWAFDTMYGMWASTLCAVVRYKGQTHRPERERKRRKKGHGGCETDETNERKNGGTNNKIELGPAHHWQLAAIMEWRNNMKLVNKELKTLVLNTPFSFVFSRSLNVNDFGECKNTKKKRNVIYHHPFRAKLHKPKNRK